MSIRHTTIKHWNLLPPTLFWTKIRAVVCLGWIPLWAFIHLTFVPRGTAEWPARVDSVRWALAIGDWRFCPSKKARMSLVRSCWEGTSLRLFLPRGYRGVIFAARQRFTSIGPLGSECEWFCEWNFEICPRCGKSWRMEVCDTIRQRLRMRWLDALRTSPVQRPNAERDQVERGLAAKPPEKWFMRPLTSPPSFVKLYVPSGSKTCTKVASSLECTANFPRPRFAQPMFGLIRLPNNIRSKKNICARYEKVLLSQIRDFFTGCIV